MSTTKETQEEWHSTACMLCAINCGLKVQTDGERHITKIIGDKDHPISQGYVCEKAQRIDYYQNGADRLSSPMRRKPDGSYEAVDWDTAITEVAERLKAVKDEHGGESFIYYGGGGQGNHLGGAYTDALLKALGVKYRSNALAQEKTGEFWVAGKMFGSGNHGDFEHAEVSVFIGKNPWQSHGFARARAVIRDIEKDPNRCMVVIDPRKSETAKKAEYHLQLKPGTDAWLLAAMVGIIVQENWVDREWMAKHTAGYEHIEASFKAIDVSRYAEISGVDETLLREVTERIAKADSVSFFEDLGMQMSVHSTLGSYLQRLIWTTTGHYGRKGTANAFVPFMSLGKASKGETGRSKKPGGPRQENVSPVVGAKIIIGLVPCNVIPEEILTDHPKRYRAMIVDSGNPVHSLADSQRMREAMRALDFSVVFDVAMTETARQADYVLPASSQFEKAEATFFNLEFPRNAFHLRQPLFKPLEGTLTEAEIHARLLEAMGILSDKDYRWLRRAAKLGLNAFMVEFLAQMFTKKKLMKYAGVILYRTLGPQLAKKYGPGMETAAVVWGLCLLYVQNSPKQAKRAGFGGLLPLAANKLFKAMLTNPSGVVYADATFEDSWNAITHPNHQINLHIPEMIEEMGKLEEGLNTAETDYPFVLSAGERRTETANTAVRNAGWHKKGIYAALRISPQDAEQMGCETGDIVKLSTARASGEVEVEISDMMPPGHISLPNGTGIDYTDENGESVRK
ncbi:MAG: molybdopterin-dependent oxidoreductase, partial [Salinisphaeraceae bacterium]|nr:molybdopterin-dependent oxidoreductase [Salinisphaeraceae bacterium]